MTGSAINGRIAFALVDAQPKSEPRRTEAPCFPELLPSKIFLKNPLFFLAKNPYGVGGFGVGVGVGALAVGAAVGGAATGAAGAGAADLGWMERSSTSNTRAAL